MDKQQAIEAQVDRIHLNDFTEMELVQKKVKEATIAGWEACEAQSRGILQSPTDAVGRLIEKKMERLKAFSLDGYKGNSGAGIMAAVLKEIREVLSANPSGAAPQAESLNVETGYKKELQGWTAFFTIGVQTFSLGDLESEERAKWYKEMLDKAFDNLSPAPRKVKCTCTSDREHENCITNCDWYNSLRADAAPAPPAAGPVWVKPPQLPAKGVNVPMRLKKGVHGNMRVEDDGIIHVNSHKCHSLAILEEWFPGLEWLDESKSAPVQQVFSREQMLEILVRMQNLFHTGKIKTLEGIEEYMNTNYPL